MVEYRKEKDLIGEYKVPINAYYGIHTRRAMENFDFTNYKIDFELIKSLAYVKKAAALSNYELGYLEKNKALAIIQATDEIIEGKFLEEFPVDPLQGGAGTSTNMNINEVIANRAIERLGGQKGDYTIVHPLDDVNMHQSTNDVYPTAIKIAAINLLRKLNLSIAELQGAFQEKEKEFSNILKIGRTELQEAVPITLGAEFSAFAEAISRDRWRTFKCEERLRVVNIGGTAVGTGLTVPKEYIFLVIEKLRQLTGLGLSRGENLMGETANADSFVEVSGILKAYANNLIKIANDLRLMNLLKEINLPELQAGSSIMPGKVNPVLLEAAMQIGYKVLSNDQIIFMACSNGSFQIVEFLPLLSFALIESLNLLIKVSLKLADFIKGITANKEICENSLKKSYSLITALLPLLGYDKATELVKIAKAENIDNIFEFLKDRLGEKLVNKIFTPQVLTALGYTEEQIEEWREDAKDS